MALDEIFNPKSIAVIGASPAQGTVGRILLEKLIDFGFPGEIYPINPKYEEIAGIKTYHKVTDVPGRVDLSWVLVPAKDVPEVVKDCVKKEVKGVVIISGGFSEIGNEELEREILDLIEGTKTRIIGPNCMGPYCPSSGIAYDESFPEQEGKVGFISQSGGIGTIFARFLADRGMRISRLVSSGNESDLKFTDYLEYFAEDSKTDIIAGYVEQIRSPKRFMKTSKKITREKPVVIWKVGRGKAGKRQQCPTRLQ